MYVCMYVYICMYVCMYVCIIPAAYLEYSEFHPTGVSGKKILRICGVEIFGVKFWSAQTAQTEPKHGIEITLAGVEKLSQNPVSFFSPLDGTWILKIF